LKIRRPSGEVQEAHKGTAAETKIEGCIKVANQVEALKNIATLPTYYQSKACRSKDLSNMILKCTVVSSRP
jgi:hypothetical protein